jgi:hypothetical protein
LLHNEIELALRDLLFNEKDSELLAQKVITRLKNETMGRRERATFLAFLINAGYYRSTFELFKTWFAEEKRLVWRPFFAVLHRAGFRPGKQFIDNVLSAQIKLEEKDRMMPFSPWDEADQRWKDFSRQHRAVLSQRQKTRREELYEKLEFARSQRMIDQEEKVLKQMRDADPNDPVLLLAEQDFEERWARHIIAEKSRAMFDEEFIDHESNLTPEESTWVEEFSQAVEAFLQDRTYLAYDLSVGFYFLELFNHALRLLRYAESDISVDWFRLELMLKARRFIECLDGLQFVETKYAEDPEATFAATYLRALILHGLGQTGSALQLLKSIVSIRPHYRSAHALLLEWSGGRSA